LQGYILQALSPGEQDQSGRMSTSSTIGEGMTLLTDIADTNSARLWGLMTISPLLLVVATTPIDVDLPAS
jgi:hypothetical protein